MAICQLSEQWIEQLSTFQLTLEEEFEVLKQNQPTAITQVAEKKMQLLTQLIETEKALHQQIPAEFHHQIASWLTNHCPTLSSLKQLVQLTEQIQRANQRNAMLLQSLMRLNEFGLNLLSGKISAQDTYGAKGQLNAPTPLSSIKLATA